MIEGIWVDGAQKSRASLTVTGESLRLENLESRKQILCQRHEIVKVYFGGNNNALVFIEWETSQGTILFYCDRTKQNLEFLKQQQRFTNQIAILNSSLKQSYTPLLIVLSLFVLGLSAVVYFRTEISSNLATLIPFQWEKKLGDQIFAKPVAETQKSTMEDFRKLTDVFHVVHPETYTFHISSAVEPNAYATIGGHVFVNRGLIMLFENNEELLGVLAHETVHVKQRHVAKMLVQGLGLFAIFEMLIGDVGGIVAVLADQGSAMMNLGYSRELEEEADRLAVELLVSQGLSPRGLPSGLQKLHDLSAKLISQSPGSEVLQKLESIEFLRSHPNTENRIATLNSSIEELEKNHQFRTLDVDWIQFQKKVKENF